MEKITTKRITRMLFEQGWLYNLKIGQLIVNDKDEDGRSVANIYVPGVHEVLQELSERENRILWLRYSQNKTLEEVAKELTLSRERIRQIECRCLRRLRQPKHIVKVLAISESRHKAILDAKIAETRTAAEKEIREYYEEELKKKETMSDVAHLTLAEKPIEELDLSVRPYNCLKRARIDTIGQLLEMTEQKLLRVRNLGLKSTQEIITRLSWIGAELKDEKNL